MNDVKTASETVDDWLNSSKTVSITICEGYINALVFVRGDALSVRAADFETLVDKVDALLEDG